MCERVQAHFTCYVEEGVDTLKRWVGSDVTPVMQSFLDLTPNVNALNIGAMEASVCSLS